MLGLADKKINVLIAYPYMSASVVNLLEEHKNEFRFVLDSGAFTAWKTGKEIKLDDYCRYIESLPFKPWQYFTLDVVGDPDKTFENYQTMLKRGFNPIPIFTRGEKIQMLDEYYKTAEIVGLGGLVGTQGNKGFVNGLMKHIAGRKCHLLGFTAIEYLKTYKPYMCDSSSWKNARRYGNVYLYGGGGKFKLLTKKDFATKPSKDIITTLETLGFDSKELARKDTWHGYKKSSNLITVASWLMFQFDVRKNLGTQFFLATADAMDFRFLLDGYSRLQKQGLI